MMISQVQRTIAAALIVSLTGCSFFGPRMQTITVSSDPTGAEVFFNGERVGTSPVHHDVGRGDDLLVEVRAPGYQTGYRKTNKSISKVGLVDVIGAAVILLPVVGLLSPAAWEHDPGSFGITLDPEVTSPTSTAEPAAPSPH